MSRQGPRREPLPFEVRHLEVVETIERTGSITRAAEELHLTQPAVSHSLRQLERRLGVDLFVRRPRGLDATAVGERLARRSRELLTQLRCLREEVREGSRGEAGTLRLTTQCYTCYYWLPPVLGELRSRFPRLQLVVSSESTMRPVEALLADEVDVAIVHTHTEHAELVHTPLFSDELVAVVPPEHPLAEKAYLEAEDFRDQHVVLHHEPQSSVLFNDLLWPAGVEPLQVSELRLTEAVIAMVEAGLAISVVARWVAAPQIESGSLRGVPLSERGITREWWVCHKRICAGHAGCEELVKLLREHGGRLGRSGRRP